MKKKNTARLVLGFAVALFLCLPVLAYLQYHWLTQLSRSETVRQRAALNAAVDHFTDHLDRELNRVQEVFSLPYVRSREEMAGEMAQRWLIWKQQARYPALVEDVYYVVRDPNASGDPVLYRFDSSEQTLIETPWSERLAGWKNQFRQTVHSSRPGLFTYRLKSDSAGAVKTPAAARPLPGVTLPVVRLPGTHTSRLEDVLVTPFARESLIVLYSRPVLSDSLLPSLVRTYFSIDETLDYQVLVSDRSKPDDVWYRSTPGLADRDFKASDATAAVGPVLSGPLPFFSTVPVEVGVDSLKWGEEQRDHAGAIQVIVVDNKKDTIPRSVERSTMVYRAETRTIRNDTLKMVRATLGADRLLQLFVRHRAGSLEAAVERTRWRNIAVSSGILLLLGVAVGLILVFSRRTQRLADQQMSFVAGISHELKTPLAVVHSAGENLKDGLITETEETRRYGALIVDESRRLIDMIEQVLDYAGISSGRKTYASELVDAAELARAFWSSVEPSLRSAGFEVHAVVEPDLPWIRGDAEALRSVLQNLVQNAVKYSRDQKWIGLRAYRDRGPGGLEVVLSVSDRGMGIEPSEKSRIFEPFYRTTSAVESRIRGSGLGLTLVKHIVETFGGRIDVESVLGMGSTFILRFPGVEDGSTPKALTPHETSSEVAL